MSAYQAPIDDILFLLNDVFKLEQFCSQFPDLEEVDKDTYTAIIQEAAKLCETVLAPINASGDSEGCRLESGEVHAPESFREAYKLFNENAWGALGGHPDFGGMGLPKTLVSAVEEIVQGANMAFGLAPMLTAGACLAVASHASEELKSEYLPRMYSGEWSGTMALTEAHAGTDLGLMRSRAKPQMDGSYEITGSKIFITWGEHDLCDNIIHLVLAKLPDAPAGSKGISLFLVPKFLPGDDGNFNQRNSVSCGSIEEKMGIHGSPTCVMNFDSAKGWLIGETNAGLACMFTMMNYERLVVGIQGLGVAEHAYQGAREYAFERKQGRSTLNKPAAGESSPIIDHQDVRRMLLDTKCLNEAGRAFYMYVAQWLDKAKFSQDAAIKKQADDRVALLTPVVKAFLTDRGLDTTVACQQVLGGHGFVKEWGQEQHVRDVRITQIYEGTNGVQAMDFVFRKTLASKGALMQDYIAEMREVSTAFAESKDRAEKLFSEFDLALDTLEEATQTLVSGDVESAGLSGTDYLNLVGYISYAYMYILQLSALDAQAPNFQAKAKTASYFFSRHLPAIHLYLSRIQSGASCSSSFAHDEF